MGACVLDRNGRRVVRPRAHVRAVKVRNVLLTHHLRIVNEESGALMGAMADAQAVHAQSLLREAGVDVEYRSFPSAAHSLHGTQPDVYVDTLLEWVASLAP